MTTLRYRSPIFARAPRLTEEHWHPDFIRHILPAAGWYVNKVQHVTAARFSFRPHERPPSLYTWALTLCLSSLSDPQQQCPCSSQPITASGSIASRYATVYLTHTGGPRTLRATRSLLKKCFGTQAQLFSMNGSHSSSRGPKCNFGASDTHALLTPLQRTVLVGCLTSVK